MKKVLYASGLVILDLLGKLLLMILFLIAMAFSIGSLIFHMPVMWMSLLIDHQLEYITESPEHQHLEFLFFCFENVLWFVVAAISFRVLVQKKLEKLG